MTDSSKMIYSNDGKPLFQVGFEALVPADGKAYGLKRGDNGPMSVKLSEVTSCDCDLSNYVTTEGLSTTLADYETIAALTTTLADYALISALPGESELLTGTAAEIEDLDNSADLAAVITKVNAILAALRTRGVVATAEEPANNEAQ